MSIVRYLTVSPQLSSGKVVSLILAKRFEKTSPLIAINS